MRTKFKEFSRLTEKEFKELWDNSIIVFDTNILLNLYKFSQKTRKIIFDMMSDLKGQLWLPYQVGCEFYIKRADQIDISNNEPKRIINELDKVLTSLSTNSCFYDELNEGVKKIKEDIEKAAKSHKKDLYKDDIADLLEKIFDGRTGDEPAQTEQNKIKDDYKDKIKQGLYCVGYKDSSKPENCAGDYFIWLQMLDVAKKQNKNLIFITEDNKNDWWQFSTKRERIGARPELLKEFTRETGGKLFQIYNLESFLNLYGKHKNKKIDKEVEKEVKSVGDDKDEDDIFDRYPRLFEALRNANIPKINNTEYSNLITNLDKITLQNNRNFINLPENISISPDTISYLRDYENSVKKIIDSIPKINFPETLSIYKTGIKN